MDSINFVDFNLIENEKSRTEILKIVNSQQRPIVLLTDDKNNIIKAYSYGVHTIIIDAISKSAEEIEKILEKANTSSFVNEKNEVKKLTWETFNEFKEGNAPGYINNPYINLVYSIYASINCPDWMLNHIKNI